MPLALLHKPSPCLPECELTFIDREPIDYARALRQHDAYASALEALGASVEVVDVNPACPDGVFVEDVAVVLDELAVATSMGSEARRAEVARMIPEVARFRQVAAISLPATLEGGDVLRVGRTLYVGETSRTNAGGIKQLEELVSPYGYSVVRVKVSGCLHLKTCITALDDETFVANPNWVDLTAFKRFKLIPTDTLEPWAGNTLPLNGGILLNASYPRTGDKIEARGYKTTRVDISEFGKAEAGLTCMSLIFR